jgi:hypothetical protein
VSSNGTWCVYRREWITWRFALKQGDEGYGELKSWLGGHLMDQDPGCKLVLPVNASRWCVQILVPVLKGEWSDPEWADRHRERLGPVSEVVRFGSPEEAALVAVAKNLKDLLR